MGVYYNSKSVLQLQVFFSYTQSITLFLQVSTILFFFSLSLRVVKRKTSVRYKRIPCPSWGSNILKTDPSNCLDVSKIFCRTPRPGLLSNVGSSRVSKEIMDNSGFIPSTVHLHFVVLGLSWVLSSLVPNGSNNDGCPVRRVLTVTATHVFYGS